MTSGPAPDGTTPSLPTVPAAPTPPYAPATHLILPLESTATDAPPHRRRPAVAVLAVALVVVLAVSTLLVVRMVRTTHAWETSASQWESLARTHGEDLATTRADLDGALAELASTQDQLATAQARITALADEKAQLGDTSESQRQLADYQARVSAAAGTVATALTTCVDGQQKLIGYLKDAASYDAADLARFEQDVETVCTAAKDANTALQQELDR